MTCVIVGPLLRLEGSKLVILDKSNNQTYTCSSSQEEALSSRATALESTTSTTVGGLSNEVTRATAAESALGDRVTAEATRAGTAESGLGTRITTEVTDRTNADTAGSDRQISRLVVFRTKYRRHHHLASCLLVITSAAKTGRGSR